MFKRDIAILWTHVHEELPEATSCWNPYHAAQQLLTSGSRKNSRDQDLHIPSQKGFAFL